MNLVNLSKMLWVVFAAVCSLWMWHWYNARPTEQTSALAFGTMICGIMAYAVTAVCSITGRLK